MEAPRAETLLVIVSDAPQDLRALEQRGVRAAPQSSSGLERLLDQVGYGGVRDVGTENSVGSDVQYAIQQVTFLLDPGTRPARDATPFLIDERADPSALYRIPRSFGPAPGAVAIRLKELIVHRNRLLFGSQFKGDVRIDAVVITGGTDDPTYQMKTASFPGIKDGDRLPFDDLLVFHGPVANFVDIAVWVSRDRKHGPSLTELLQKELSSTEFKTAAITLAGLAVAAPHAAAIVGGLGAAATICNISSRLLSAALGVSIGLYRTSALAHEGFGVGRHPSTGAVRAQDFSFAFDILDVTQPI